RLRRALRQELAPGGVRATVVNIRVIRWTGVVVPNEYHQPTGHANEVCRVSAPWPREPAAELWCYAPCSAARSVPDRQVFAGGACSLDSLTFGYRWGAMAPHPSQRAHDKCQSDEDFMCFVALDVGRATRRRRSGRIARRR